MKMSKRPISPLFIRRTPSPVDAAISPFLVDPASLRYLTRLSRDRYKGSWLHVPVLIRVLPTRAAALATVARMTPLRHPNLEQLLGAVVDPAHPKCVMTEFVDGVPLAEKLAPGLDGAAALTVALDVARALVYLHAATSRAHGAVSVHTVLYDCARARAVLQLTTTAGYRSPSAAPELRDGISRPTRAADVYSLAIVVLQVFAADLNVVSAESVPLLPKRLQSVLRGCLQSEPRKRPSMEELCQALSDCVDSLT